jgi:23S rRNA pseudouridine2605 synthase
VLAQAGEGSRRDMEAWISAGRVTVNGAKAQLGTRVSPGDAIRVDGRLLRAPAGGRLPRILIYHKPEGEIVSRDDPAGRPSVFDRLPRLRGAKWLSVGRLDFNTGGLLILSTSGELVNRMMHPRFELEREYAVRVLGRLDEQGMTRLRAGIRLSDGLVRVQSIAEAGGEGANRWYRLVITEGRNRVVRRLFDAVGCPVSRLMRVRFGSVQLPRGLSRGQYTELPSQETRLLLRSLGMADASPAARRD